MKIITLSIPLNVILVSLLVINLAQSEQPSTVFVLETSDSDSLVSSNNHNNNNKNNNHKAESPQLAHTSSAANAKLKTADDSIIIDDSSAQPNNNDKKNQRNQNQPSQQLKSTTGQADRLNQERQFKQNQSQNQQQTTPSSVHERSLNDDANRHRDSAAASRRLEEESNLTPIVHKITGNHNQSAQKQVNQQKPHKPSSSSTTTTASPYVDEHNTHGAKSEERLLISITSDDDETQSHKVSSGGGGGGGIGNSGTSSEDAQQSSSLLQPNRNQKRKPSITISIQDANINKQGSGSSAVIVRPSEDGHSIVIATVASPNGANGGNNNKFKPIITSTNDNINSPTSNNQQPYRDPINNPIQNIVQQHQIASTTRRPSLVNDYNNPPINANNPINLGQSDEQPQRPTQPSFDEPVSSYETPRPRPKPSGSNSGSGHNDNNDNNNNGGSSQLSTSSSSSSSSSSPHSGGSYDPETNDQSGSGVNSEPKYPLNEKNCGLLHETRIVGGEEANPDNFMWMAAIIKSRPKDGDPRPFCGGSLITRRHVLTAAHCLDGLAPRDVLVRLSSYDFDDTASSSSSDYAIDQFRVPAQYSKKTHVADIAIMRLKTPIQLTDNYKSVCMPQPRRSYVGALGTVTGYGSNSQTFRRASPKLRQVTVPIWENRKCSIVYKRNLTESFLCAGYEEGGKDACQGDSGGPLMTEGPEQKMMIVGVVSHGIGCGSPGYPGVYTRVSTYMEWIEKNTKE